MRIFDEKAVKKGFINNPNNDNRQVQEVSKGKMPANNKFLAENSGPIDKYQNIMPEKLTTGVTDQQGAVRNITGWLKTFRAGKCLPSHSCKNYDHETLLLE